MDRVREAIPGVPEMRLVPYRGSVAFPDTPAISLWSSMRVLHDVLEDDMGIWDLVTPAELRATAARLQAVADELYEEAEHFDETNRRACERRRAKRQAQPRGNHAGQRPLL